MSSIVLELQQDVLSGKTPIADLLRKALLVARKLDQVDFQKWIELEMNGYRPPAELPEYRKLQGHVQARNRFHGWIPVDLGANDIQEQVSTNHFGHSIAELETLLRSEEKGFHVNMTPGENQLLNSYSSHPDTIFARFFQVHQVSNIIDAVKTIILNWTITMENAGILGEGMSFTPEEKKQAAATIYNNVNNFYGNVSNAQFQQGTSHSSQNMTKGEMNLDSVNKLIKMISTSMNTLGIGDDQRNELLAEVATIKAQLGSPKPKTSVIKTSLKTVLDIVKSATGHVAAELILHFHEYFPNL